MSRLKTAEHMALTDPYWKAYLDGLNDKHNLRHDDTVAHHVEVNRLLQQRLDRHEEEEARRARREPWDNDWEPVDRVNTPAVKVVKIENIPNPGAPRNP